MDLIGVAKSGDIVRVRELLDSGEDPNLQNDYDTALMEASERDHAEIVRLLLEHDADLNIYNDDGDTALMKASRNGHTEIVKLLLDRDADGVDINFENLPYLKRGSFNRFIEELRKRLNQKFDSKTPIISF